MVEIASSQKKAVGKACFDLDLRGQHRPRPTFLHRNLMSVLDSHERALSRRPDELPYKDMVANEKQFWGWDFPTTAMLDEFMNGNKPILQLASLKLKHPRFKARPQDRDNQRSVSSPDLSWLLDPEASYIWPCTVAVSVSNLQSSKKQVFYETVPARILQSQGSQDISSFDIRLQKPIFIELNELFVVADSGNHGSRWKKTTTAKYVLELAIQCQDSEDTSAFLGQLLEGRKSSTYDSIPLNESILKATWDDLPFCPQNDCLLTVRRAKGHKSLELNHKMEVAMGWISQREHRLKLHNRLFECKTQTVRQLPTPSASDDMETARKMCSTVWTYHDGSRSWTTTTRDLTCPLCGDNKEYGYFDRLMLHCQTRHAHFKFESKYNIYKQTSLTPNARVVFSEAEKSIEKHGDVDKERINWVAPDRAFNLKAHMNGDESWTHQVRAKSRKGFASRVNHKPSPAMSLHPVRKRPAPDEVEDLPVREPKRHRVPDVPGVNFYHTTSKQPIQPGEYVSESDDDVEETWLNQKEGRALQDLGITGAAKDFTKAFNQHLAREQSNSSILVRDAIIRFARSYKERLRDVQWRREFIAKLCQLQKGGIIGEDIVNACTDLIPPEPGEPTHADEERSAWMQIEEAMTNGAHEPRKQPNGISRSPTRAGSYNSKQLSRDTNTPNGTFGLVHRERKRWAGRKAAQRDEDLTNGHSTPNGTTSAMKIDAPTEGQPTHQSNRKTVEPTMRKKLCLCGQSAKDMRGSIACADLRCVRQEYHLACVGLEKRVNGWRCNECS